jgi:bifunctional DNA-binding transcriptional regulator/antitoxin component of YhaV-PrlF toxin-antitoxin module
VITQEDPETGDLLLPLPEPLLRELDWKEGDDIEFNIDDQGRIVMSKTSK